MKNIKTLISIFTILLMPSCETIVEPTSTTAPVLSKNYIYRNQENDTIYYEMIDKNGYFLVAYDNSNDYYSYTSFNQLPSEIKIIDQTDEFIVFNIDEDFEFYSEDIALFYTVGGITYDTTYIDIK